MTREKAEKEYVAKADSMKLVAEPQKLGLILMRVSEALPEDAKELEAIMKAANEKIEKGKLFEETGSSGAGAGKDAFEKIEKAAESRAAQKKITKEQAMDELLSEPEFAALYKEYEADRK